MDVMDLVIQKHGKKNMEIYKKTLWSIFPRGKKDNA